MAARLCRLLPSGRKNSFLKTTHSFLITIINYSTTFAVTLFTFRRPV